MYYHGCVETEWEKIIVVARYMPINRLLKEVYHGSFQDLSIPLDPYEMISYTCTLLENIVNQKASRLPSLWSKVLWP